MSLLHDIYVDQFARGIFDARAFMLSREGGGLPHPRLDEVPVARPNSPADFDRYVERLADVLRLKYEGVDFDAIHLQHVGFGASLALLRGFPKLPAIALIHGTDLLAASESAVQLRALRAIAERADYFVAPSDAMRASFAALAGRAAQDRTVVIPWGVRDDAFPEVVRNDRPRNPPRFLFAGRLAREKGIHLLLASDVLRAAGLAVTASQQELATLTSDLSGVTPLGWLPREELWRRFDDFDALLVPSPSLEAFALGAVEAQARGLPVLYQPTSGLLDVIGASGIKVDFAGGGLERFIAAPPSVRTAALERARQEGYVNAARYRLASTVKALSALTALAGGGPSAASGTQTLRLR